LASAHLTDFLDAGPVHMAGIIQACSKYRPELRGANVFTLIISNIQLWGDTMDLRDLKENGNQIAFHER
jgi:hypothetical protein